MNGLAQTWMLDVIRFFFLFFLSRSLSPLDQNRGNSSCASADFGPRTLRRFLRVCRRLTLYCDRSSADPEDLAPLGRSDRSDGRKKLSLMGPEHLLDTFGANGSHGSICLEPCICEWMQV